MKTIQTKPVLLFFLLAISHVLMAQPSTNLKVNRSYSLKGTLPVNNSMLSRMIPDAINEKRERFLENKNREYTLEDTVKWILPDSIYMRSLTIQYLRYYKDSLTKLLADVSIHQNNTSAAAWIDPDKLVAKKNELTDSISHIDTLLAQQKRIITALKDSLLERAKHSGYTNILSVTSDINRKIRYFQEMRRSAFVNEYRIGHEDTAGAKQAILRINDSINHLITLRTSIREAKKSIRAFNFFPVISMRSAKSFFGNVSDTNNTIVDSSNFYLFQNLSTFSTSNVASNITIHALLFALYAGPVRVEGHTFFSMPKTDSASQPQKINALSSLAAGGGNFTLQAQFPLISFTFSRETVGQINFSSILCPKIAFDIPSSADSIHQSGRFSMYAAPTVNNKLEIVLEKRASFYGEFSYSYIMPNGLFYDKLGGERKYFHLASITAGLNLAKSFGISYTSYLGHIPSSIPGFTLNNTLTFTKSL